MINRIATQMSTIAALSLIWYADQWLTVGLGLNPYIALPIATLLLIAPYSLKD